MASSESYMARDKLRESEATLAVVSGYEHLDVDQVLARAQVEATQALALAMLAVEKGLPE